MNIQQYDIKNLPFFHSFMQGSHTKAVIDIQAFNLWLEQVQHIDLLTDAEEAERAEAYRELKSSGALDLRDAMKEW